MLPISSEYYGDDQRWFLGTVIDNTPPYGMEGKVKVHIDGIHSTKTVDIAHRDLPWAQVMLPTNTGGASGHGEIPRLLPGSRVFGVFLDGKHSQLPLVLGHLHTTEYPTTTQYKNILIPDAPVEVANRETVMAKYFIDIGYKPHITASIMGAAHTVSKLDPNKDTGNRFGIMGWNKDSNRFKSLVTFAEQFDQRYGKEDFVTQLAFIANELRTVNSELVGNLRKTYQIQDSPTPTRSRSITGLGSSSVFVSYFDKLFQQTIIKEHLVAMRNKSIEYHQEITKPS